MKRAALLAASISVLLVSAPAFADPSTPAPAPISNPEMRRIFDADQAERSGDTTKIDWSVLGPRDAERRKATRGLLTQGALHTGADFSEAAFVFQHGSGDDFLIAHTLAIIATKMGDPSGPWIAAATLDRYLQNAGRKQIYGTQLSWGSGQTTDEPYDRDLISDGLRRELNVPDQASQALRLQQIKAQQAAQSPAAPAAASPAAASTNIKCDAGPLDRVFVRATWRIMSCSNGFLIATKSAATPAVIVVTVINGKVAATVQGGGDDGEGRVAKAAFEAMDAAQIADFVDQTKAIRP